MKRNLISSALRAVFGVAVIAGCTHSPAVSIEPAGVAATLLEAAYARPSPDISVSRIKLRIDSTMLALAGSIGGGAVIERPGKFHLDLIPPIGGPLFTAHCDGVSLSTLMMSTSRHLVAESADDVVRRSTSGVLSIDDFAGLLLGDLPLDGAPVKSVSFDENRRTVAVLEGPEETIVTINLDANGYPDTLTTTLPSGGLLLFVDYAQFEEVDGYWLPSGLDLTLPTLDLDITLTYKGWSVPEIAPIDWKLTVPSGFTTESLEVATSRLLGQGVP